MLYFPLTAIINGAISAFLGVFIYSRNTKDPKYITYALSCLSLVIWSYGYFFWQLADNASSALFWSRVLMSGAIFVPFFYLHHLYLLFNKKMEKMDRALIVFGYLAGIIFLLADFTPFFIKSVQNKMFFKFWPNPGILYHFFLVIWIFYAILSLGILYAAAKRKRTYIEKRHIKFIFIATIITWVGAFTNFPLWYGINLPPWGNCFVSIYLIMVAYAILKFQWMDIEVIIRKTLVFAGLLVSVFAMLVLPALIIQEYLFRGAGTSGRLIGLTISGIIIILTMRRIEFFLVNVTDKYLFQKKYDYKELLRTFTSEVLMVLELDKLVDITVDKLSEIIKLKSAAVLLFNEEDQQFEVVAQQNIKDPDLKLIRPDSIVTFMEETHGYILVKDLNNKKIFIPESIQEIIDKLNAELIIPMVIHDKIVGVLSLGKKKSDEDYSQDDLDIIVSLSKTLAIAISNAQQTMALGRKYAGEAQQEKMAVIGTLSAGINHEICNPLGIARGQCEAFLLNLKDGLYKTKTDEELIAKAKDIMAKVIHETDRATAITKKLSQFAKPAKGDSELVDIPKEIDDVIGLVGYELKLEKIEIEKRIVDGLSNIFVDRKQFQEVLFNLIRNAGQAIKEKGKVTITAYNDKGKVFINIQDTGSGIPVEKTKQLFNPFFTTKDPGKGTGLGLFIVRQVIEKNGGHIYLKETKVGEGTTFTLEFPAASAENIEQKAKVKK